MKELLEDVEYGTLALCLDGQPYSVPLNFVHDEGSIYFHGKKGGRKMLAILSNPRVSFSVVKNYSIIPSYFSTTKGLASPATQFFKSAIFEGVAEIIEDRGEKILALSLLMKKLQSEGGYKALDEAVYEKIINATGVIKMRIDQQELKLKFGQKLSQERFDMVIKNLEKRQVGMDIETVKMMKYCKEQDNSINE